jgi:hypothetical protein
MMREPKYLRLNGPALLDYAHRRGVWLTDYHFSPANNRELAERMIAEKMGDPEIRNRIRARETEIDSHRAAWGAIVAAVASVLGTVGAWITVIWSN